MNNPIRAERLHLFYGGLGAVSISNLLFAGLLLWLTGGLVSQWHLIWGFSITVLAIMQAGLWLASNR